CASRGDGTILWKWPLPGHGKIVDVLPAGDKHPVTLVVQTPGKLFGLAGPTGEPRWCCDAPGNPTIRLLQTNDPHGLPRILRQQGTNAASTVCQQAWPTTPTGEYLSPTP